MGILYQNVPLIILTVKLSAIYVLENIIISRDIIQSGHGHFKWSKGVTNNLNQNLFKKVPYSKAIRP